MKKILVLIIGLVMIFSVVGCSNDGANDPQGDEGDSKESQEQVQEETEDVIVISASALSKAYEEDEAKADELYKGKMLAIEGKVMTRGAVGERTFVILEAIEGSAETGVQCFFEDEKEIAKVEDLREEDLVTIKGEVDEKGTMNVMVIDCVLK